MLVTINIGTKSEKIYLDVHGYHEPAYPGSREDPPGDERFDIVHILYEGTRIDHILDAFGVDYSEIENKCLEEIKE